jgi:hypothetical protein
MTKISTPAMMRAATTAAPTHKRTHLQKMNTRKP